MNICLEQNRETERAVQSSVFSITAISRPLESHSLHNIVSLSLFHIRMTHVIYIFMHTVLYRFADGSVFQDHSTYYVYML